MPIGQEGIVPPDSRHQCRRCRYVYPARQMYRIPGHGDGLYCQHCRTIYRECDGCNIWVTHTARADVEGDNGQTVSMRLCEDCRNGGQYRHCTDCNITVPRARQNAHNCIGADLPHPWGTCYDCYGYTRNRMPQDSLGPSLLSYAGYAFCVAHMRSRAQECLSCHRLHRSGTTYYAYTRADGTLSERMCQSCRSQRATECRHCAEWYENGMDPCRCFETRTCGCGTCRDARRLIKGYSYKPEPVFKGTGEPMFKGKGGLFLGFELEVEVSSGSGDYESCGNCSVCDDGEGCTYLPEGVLSVESVAQIAQDAFGDLVYLKTDGSIRHGFEIVSHPLGYEWMMGEFPWQALDTIRDAGCVPEDNCGLHIHASRNAFSGPAHEYRWLQFIHRNEPGVTAVARRRGSYYAAFYTQPRFRRHLAPIVRAFSSKGEIMSTERYQAVNTLNRNTLEVRAFASTTDARELQAALGLVDASIRYTAQLDARRVKDGALSFARFAEWADERKRYQPLMDEIHAYIPVLA